MSIAASHAKQPWGICDRSFEMPRRLFAVIGPVSVMVFLWLVSIPAAGQAPAAGGKNDAPPVRTPWGEPDLQGIWTDEHATPLERPEWVGGREFFTDEEIAAL